jgi:hypothetical protein
MIAKNSPQAQPKENIKAALIGSAVTLIIPVLIGFYYLGGVNQQLNNLSSKLNSIENSNRALSSGLTLTNSILIRVLNHVNISENEKIAIYDEINKTIKELPATVNLTSLGQASINDSQDQINTLEPEYIKILKKWEQKISLPLLPSDAN